MGLKLGVITNGLAVKQWEKIIRLGLQHFFHAVVISEEAGVEKPNEKIFAKAAAKIKVNPRECMMVGDRLDQDIPGAKKAGFATVQVVRGEQNQKPAEKGIEPDYILPDLSSLPKIISRLQ
jgi:putative hydrolase of the HAD superfamily